MFERLEFTGPGSSGLADFQKLARIPAPLEQAERSIGQLDHHLRHLRIAVCVGKRASSDESLNPRAVEIEALAGEGRMSVDRRSAIKPECVPSLGAFDVHVV